MDSLEIVKTHSRVKGSAHFFAGTWEDAKSFLDFGFALSFTGVITFTHDYDKIIENTPLGMIMSETDSPYVAPTPFRGKRNEPVFVVETVAAIAKIRNEDEQYVQATLLQNASEFFKLRLN